MMIPMISAVRRLLPSLLELLEGSGAWLLVGVFEAPLFVVEDGDPRDEGVDVIWGLGEELNSCDVVVAEK
jgi:hypothetical protein